jgi:hypothetical protein
MKINSTKPIQGKLIKTKKAYTVSKAYALLKNKKVKTFKVTLSDKLAKWF